MSEIFPYPKIDHMVGRTFISVERRDGPDGDMLVFQQADGSAFEFYHYQNCCEDVHIEDVVGDLVDLEGTPLLVAEERSQEMPEASESGTWTFYTFRTIKGSVDVRWNGQSNGYYSEDVDLRFVSA